jgi:prepilin-type N-terminal cleavage/methylation domain-containing protein
MKHPSDEYGFSLVELLIALAILSLVVVTVTSTFGYAERVLQLMTDAAYQLDDITLIRRLLVDALGQLTSSGGMEQQTRFLGERNGFTIAATGPRILGSAGPITLKVEAAQRGGLTIAWQNLPESGSGTGFTRRLVAADYRVWLSYYAASTGWTTVWSDAGYAPSLLRVEFARKGGEDTDLGLTIPIRPVRPAACAIRPSVKGCEGP